MHLNGGIRPRLKKGREQEVEMQEASTPQALSSVNKSSGVVTIGTYVGSRRLCWLLLVECLRCIYIIWKERASQ